MATKIDVFKTGEEFYLKEKWRNTTLGKKYKVLGMIDDTIFFINDKCEHDHIYFKHARRCEESVTNDTKNNGGETDYYKIKNPTPTHYGEKCRCGRKIDWYVIGDLYNKGKGEAWSHAGKKLLRAGEGHKTLIQDINEVIDSLNRWKEQLEDEGV